MICNSKQSSTSLHNPEIMNLARVEICLIKLSKTGACSLAHYLDIASRNSKQTKDRIVYAIEGLRSIPRSLFYPNRNLSVVVPRTS